MSLIVSDEMVQKAANDSMTDNDFIGVIKSSLPKAWEIVEKLAAKKKSGVEGVVSYDEKHMEDETRGQILRMFASNAIRGAVEKHFDLALVFQNCHKAGTISRSEVGTQAYQDFVSAKAQILNQSAEMRDC